MRIFLLGFMGSGKSYWGRHLSQYLELPLYDLDEEIVQREGKSIASVFAENGETYFREKEKAMLHELAAQEAFLVSCGGGAPCFYDNMSFMKQQGLTIWLNPSVEVMVKRLEKKKEKRPLIKDLDHDALQAFVAQKLEERSVFYAQASLIVDPVPLNVATFAEKIKACIKPT